MDQSPERVPEPQPAPVEKPAEKPAEATKVQVTTAHPPQAHAQTAPRKSTGKYHYPGDQPTHLPGGPEIQPGLNDFSGYTDPEVLAKLAAAVEHGLLKPA